MCHLVSSTFRISICDNTKTRQLHLSLSRSGDPAKRWILATFRAGALPKQYAITREDDKQTRRHDKNMRYNDRNSLSLSRIVAWRPFDLSHIFCRVFVPALSTFRYATEREHAKCSVYRVFDLSLLRISICDNTRTRQMFSLSCLRPLVTSHINMRQHEDTTDTFIVSSTFRLLDMRQNDNTSCSRVVAY